MIPMGTKKRKLVDGNSLPVFIPWLLTQETEMKTRAVSEAAASNRRSKVCGLRSPFPVEPALVAAPSAPPTFLA
jgi:hypothetical protein